MAREDLQKAAGITEDGVVALRQDESGFIDRLLGRAWVTSERGTHKQLVFKSTFSPDSGVVETFSKAGDLDTLSPFPIPVGPIVGLSSSLAHLDSMKSVS